MIPKIKHILYASDLSENSAHALSWAMMFSHQHDARITFLHVTEEVSPHATMAIRSFMGEAKWKEMSDTLREEANTEIDARIHNFCDTVAGEMDTCPAKPQEVVIRQGIPVEHILSEAEARNCDLIVMGTHGAGLFKEAVIGSNARRVVRRSRIPVMVIPLTDTEKEEQQIVTETVDSVS